jgi:hypothetical protein
MIEATLTTREVMTMRIGNGRISGGGYISGRRPEGGGGPIADGYYLGGVQVPVPDGEWEGGQLVEREFFDWLARTYRPTWLQPLDEPAGSTATSGLAGPNSTSTTSVSFGEGGLVSSGRTAAGFSSSRIVFPKGAPLDAFHQSAGGTLMGWFRLDPTWDGNSRIIYMSNDFGVGFIGVWLFVQNRPDVDPQYSNCVRFVISRAGGVAGQRSVYNNYTAEGITDFGMIATDVVSTNEIHMFAITHSLSASICKIYIDGVEVASATKSYDYSTQTSHTDPTVGTRSPSGLTGPFVGTIQGLTLTHDVLSPAEIASIWSRSIGS